LSVQTRSEASHFCLIASCCEFVYFENENNSILSFLFLYANTIEADIILLESLLTVNVFLFSFRFAIYIILEILLIKREKK
jgi:hypothetical protein